MRSKKLLQATVGVLLSVGVSAASATDYIEVNGHHFACTNSCIVTVFGNGTFRVDDSNGGRADEFFPDHEEPLG